MVKASALRIGRYGLHGYNKYEGANGDRFLGASFTKYAIVNPQFFKKAWLRATFKSSSRSDGVKNNFIFSPKLPSKMDDKIGKAFMHFFI